MKLQSLSSTFLSKYRLVSTKQSDTSEEIMEWNSSTKRNRTLVEAASTMLIFSKAPMFLWAAAVATACYTQNRSLIHTRHNKTPYELVHDKKPGLIFLRVFDALCYPTNDSKDLGKFQAKADIGIFVRLCTHKVQEPEPIIMTPGQLKSGLTPTDKELEMLFQPMFDEYFKQSRVNEPVPSATAVNAQVVPPGTSLSTKLLKTQTRIQKCFIVNIRYASSSPTSRYCRRTHSRRLPNHSRCSYNLSFKPCILGRPVRAQSSSGNVNSAEPTDHLRRWTKDHPLDNIVGNPS
ncbi:retrovirus-related pol polyprotein from transposon TNT 1-94 [Tanacetum coccineum]